MSNPISRRGLLGGLFAAVASVLGQPETPAQEQAATQPGPAGSSHYSYDTPGSRGAGYDPKLAALHGETIYLSYSSAGLCDIVPLTAEPKPDPTA
jgi:hypothetical protein